MWFARKVPFENDLTCIASWAENMYIIIADTSTIPTVSVIPESHMLPILLTRRAASIKYTCLAIAMIATHISTYSKLIN